jgi:hypothetical protein
MAAPSFELGKTVNWIMNNNLDLKVFYFFFITIYLDFCLVFCSIFKSRKCELKFWNIFFFFVAWIEAWMEIDTKVIFVPINWKGCMVHKSITCILHSKIVNWERFFSNTRYYVVFVRFYPEFQPLLKVEIPDKISQTQLKSGNNQI